MEKLIFVFGLKGLGKFCDKTNPCAIELTFLTDTILLHVFEILKPSIVREGALAALPCLKAILPRAPSLAVPVTGPIVGDPGSDAGNPEENI